MELDKQKIYSKNNVEISDRIECMVNSLVGVDTSKIKMNEKGMFEHFEINPLYNERKSLEEIMIEDKVPGLCIAVINNFEIEWVKAFGIKNAETEEPVSIETMFQAASISKSLVATVVLKLVEKGLLDLDEPINSKFKNWTIPSNEFTKDNEITLKHILTHSSGINSPDGGFDREDNSAPTILQVLKGEAPAKNHPVKVEFIPGSKQQYSNHGFIILEKLVEDITGKKLNELAQEFIFKPLGMKDSLFGYPSEEIQKRMSFSHRNGVTYEPHIGLSPHIFGCGGLITTPLDLARFALGLINAYRGAKNSILTQTIAQKMISSQVKIDPHIWFGKTSFGLGVFLDERKDTYFFEHAGGNNPGAASEMIANPNTGQGAIIMTNSLTAHNRLINSLLYTIAEEYGWSK
jgi:CubicO group peptidase (beta-lactamase class C family)